MKTCVECKWHKSDRMSSQWDMCTQPYILEKKRDPVSGRPLSFCSGVRTDWGWLVTTCGSKGRYWEPKEPS